MEIFTYTLVSLFIYMNISFVISLIRRDNCTADIFYGGGFIVIALITYFLTSYKPLSFILMLLIFVWGIRLAVRIAFRNHGKPEDYRYKKYRNEWGKFFIPRSYLQIYLLQGFVIYLVSFPIIFLGIFGSFLYFLPLLILAIILWTIGFLFESIADLELDKFIKNPNNKGRLLTSGLWRYSRHPNYFGESLMWWAIAIFTIGGIYYTFGLRSLIVLISPVLITYTLLKYSGVPMLEKKAQEKHGWVDYKSKTNMFFPWFPKK